LSILAKAVIPPLNPVIVLIQLFLTRSYINTLESELSPPLANYLPLIFEKKKILKIMIIILKNKRIMSIPLNFKLSKV